MLVKERPRMCTRTCMGMRTKGGTRQYVHVHVRRPGRRPAVRTSMRPWRRACIPAGEHPRPFASRDGCGLAIVRVRARAWVEVRVTPRLMTANGPPVVADWAFGDHGD